MKTIELNNGVQMPPIGFGTYKIPADEAGERSILDAIHAGYRLIDGAAKYENEDCVGKAIADSGLKRDSLFITSKVWPENQGYDNTMRAFEKSIRDLNLDYLDLYLIHWPASPSRHDDWEKINASTWKALENLLDINCVRAIGVCNFKQKHLEPLLAKANVCPMVNQIECNPGHQDSELRSFCSDNGIIVQAWSPLGRGRILENPLLIELAAKYGKSVAQICLRWEVQQGIVPIPKSVNPERIRQNIDIFDFELSDADVQAINALPEFGESGLDPDTVNFS